MSPLEIDASDAPARRLADIRRRAVAQGNDFHLNDVEKKFERLLDAYGKYRALTFNPNAPQNSPQWSNARGRMAAEALQKLIGDLQIAQRISVDKGVDRRHQLG